jgi:hypothetical protein
MAANQCICGILKVRRVTRVTGKRVIFPTGFVVSCGVMMRPWNVGKL